MSKLPQPHTSMHGILNINKPCEITSMDVVRTIKRISRQKRVGHGGTLDPFASGVLLISIGQATRVMEHLVNSGKEYYAEIEFGIETDTYDIQGTVTSQMDSSKVTLTQIERTLKSFKGNILQIPPMYSALKIRGERLYKLARAGIEIEREAREVEVHSIQILDWVPPIVTLNVSCGRGFYMRSLAFDIGRKIGTGAFMRKLKRRRIGVFDISESVKLSEIESLYQKDNWATIINNPDTALQNLRAIVVNRSETELIKNGRPLPRRSHISNETPGELCRLYNTDGRFLAILCFNGSLRQWEPHRVFNMLG